MTGLEGPWEFDRRVSNLLKRNVDEDEHIRFAIEGVDGQCIIALNERLATRGETRLRCRCRLQGAGNEYITVLSPI